VRLLGRVLIIAVILLGVIFVGVNWIAPVAFSFYAARKAPQIARVVPTDLKDKSVSQAPGKKLSYSGYEFEVPWSDIDEAKTSLYPKDKPEKTRVVLVFRSGLRLMVTALPPRDWANFLAKEMKVSPQAIESTFGESDYCFAKTLYEFSPDKMSHWSLSRHVHMREEFLLIIKSMALSESADDGIFNLENQSYKGFQEGNPQLRRNRIIVHLYSDEGSVEFVFFQKEYQNSAGVTQPEINRIVLSLRKAPQNGATAAQMARR